MVKQKNWKTNLSITSAFATIITAAYTFFSDFPIYTSLILVIVSIALMIFGLVKRRKKIFDFEYIEQVITIEIVDEKREKIKYMQEATFKCLKDNAHYFYNNFYSVNNLIHDIRVEPGIIEEIYEDERKIHVKSTLGRVLKKGEIVKRKIELIYKNALEEDRGNWTTTRYYPGGSLKATIIFPKEKPFLDYKASKKIGYQYLISKIQPMKTLIKGKPALVWEISNLDLGETYRLDWKW